MSQVCITLPFVLVLVQYVSGYPGDPVMYLPPFEMRAMGPYPSQFPYHHVNRHKPYQVPYSDVVPKKPLQTPDRQSNQNMTFGEIFDALNKMSLNGTEYQRVRSSEVGERKVNTYTPPAVQMNFASKYAPPATYDTSPDPTPTSSQPKMPLLKPDLASVLAPKVTNKMSGLMSLLPALLAGPMSGGLEKTGMKDLLINGIIKPLLVSKGGIKTLISKLTIPVIGLLLINLEVLVIIWWLWEDCDIVPLEPSYPASYSKPAYNYNNNSYR